MPNTTPTFGFNLPLVNNATDADLWGGQLNSNWTSLDTILQLPVGSLYWNKSVSTNPAALLGYGTWTAITDKFMVARGSTYTGTGGEATDSIIISAANLPSSLTLTQSGTGDVDNSQTGKFASAGAGARTVAASISLGGSGSAILVDTIPPYQAAYCWERTA